MRSAIFLQAWIVVTSLLCVVVADVAIQGLPSCLSRDLTLPFKYVSEPTTFATAADVIQQQYPTISMDIGEWDTANVTSYIAAILLHEVMQLSLALNGVVSTALMYPRMLSGQSSFTLEMWPNNARPLYDKSVVHDQSIMDLGQLGYLGEVHVFVPKSIATAYPNINFGSFRVLYDPAVLALLPPAGTTPPGEYEPGEDLCADYPVFCSNGMYIPPQCQPGGSAFGTCRELWHLDPTGNHGETEQKIVDFNLPLVVVYLGSRFGAEVARCATTGPPNWTCIFYFWAPDALLAENPVVKVRFPTATAACWSNFNASLAGTALTSLPCDWTAEYLGKLGSTAALAPVPHVSRFLKLLTISEGDINTMLNGLDPVNKPNAHFDAACTWVKQHVSTWSEWIPPPPVGYVRYRDTSLNGWGALVATLAAITIMLSFANMVLIYRHQTNKQLRFASPFLLGVATTASTLLSIALLLPLVAATAITCVSAIYFACVGLLFWQVALFARAWRIFAIASNRQFSILVMGRLVLIRGTSSQIAGSLVLLVAVVAMLLMPWTLGGAPWEPRRVDNMYSASLFNVVCPAGPRFTFLLPIVALHAVLGSVSFGLAVATRKVATITNDSQQVLVSSATLASSLLLSLLIWITDPNPASFTWLVPMAMCNLIILLGGPVYPVATVFLGEWRQDKSSMSALRLPSQSGVAKPSRFTRHMSGRSMPHPAQREHQRERGAITQLLDADENEPTWANPMAPTSEPGGHLGVSGLLRSSTQHSHMAARLVGDDAVRALDLNTAAKKSRGSRGDRPASSSSSSQKQQQQKQEAVVARVAVDLMDQLVPVRNCAHVWTPWTLARILVVPSMRLISILPRANDPAEPWSCLVRKDHNVAASKANASGLVSLAVNKKRVYDIHFQGDAEATAWIKNFDELLLS
ncbi:hypothetical protein BC828DRAFT_375678 [Blastocladiella britannica]|nr:hypothetical protein BC828DRAFT_375678 [Blastocladiella britannica]